MYSTLALCAVTAASALAVAGEPTPATGAPTELVIQSVVVTLIDQVAVPAQESGVLVRIAPQEGQLVKKGDLLAQINDTQAKLALQRAQVELETAQHQAANRISIQFGEKSKEVADAELQRATDSLQRYPKSISETEIDRLRLAAQKAALAVEQSKFEYEISQFAKRLRQTDVDLANEALARRRIVAPLDGVVVEIYHREGEWVEPSKSVFRILRLDRLRAEGFVKAQDVTGELVGRDVVLETVLPGGAPAKFSGRLVFLSPEVSAVNGQMRLWAEIVNDGMTLRPGLRGALRIPAVAEQSPR